MKRTQIKWWISELGLQTKKEVESEIRRIISLYPNNQPINKAHEHWLLKVLRHHYQFEAKVGVGIRHLEVRSNPSWSGATRGVWIVRTDGTHIDISWVVALKPGGRPDPKDDVSKAARYEVFPQIHEHHAVGACADCPLCGLPMERGINVHVDHAEPFAELLKQFLNIRGLDYENVAITDLGLDSQFADRTLAGEWQNYHRERAQLRITHAQCNLSRKAA